MALLLAIHHAAGTPPGRRAAAVDASPATATGNAPGQPLRHVVRNAILQPKVTRAGHQVGRCGEISYGRHLG